MGRSQDKNQHAHIVGDTGYQHLQVLHFLPETKLHESVTDIKKIIGNQEDIVEIVGCCRIVFHKAQNEHPAIPIEKSADKDDYKNRQDQVNDICGHIVVHVMQTF